MVNLYCNLIKKGLLTIEQIPDRWRAAVIIAME